MEATHLSQNSSDRTFTGFVSVGNFDPSSKGATVNVMASKTTSRVDIGFHYGCHQGPQKGALFFWLTRNIDLNSGPPKVPKRKASGQHAGHMAHSFGSQWTMRS